MWTGGCWSFCRVWTCADPCSAAAPVQVLAAGQAPSAVYGAEHLLRLIVKLPELLPHTGATEEALQLLISRVEDLLTYMQVRVWGLLPEP